MTNAPTGKISNVQEFIDELTGFYQTAEEALQKIEQDYEANRSLFEVFTNKMYTIRGTAQQLRLPRIAEIAELGEEIAIKAAGAEKRGQIRRCVGALWDTLTTVKYLLQHLDAETTEEQGILINRLNTTLRALGGAREKVNADEIEELLKSRG